MTRETQKERESKFLLHFKDLYSDFPIGQIEPCECPDFIINSKQNKKIGIELVEIFPFLTHEEKAHLQLTKNKSVVIELAKQQFESTFKKCLMVSLSFNRNFRCSKSERKKFAELIANDVYSCYTTLIQSGIPSERFSNNGFKTPFLEHMLIYQKEIKSGLWDSGVATLTRDLQFHELQSKIQSKEDILPQIKKKAGEAWLLIIEPHDMLNFDGNYFFQEIQTGYDKIFMLRTIYEEVILLK